MIPPELLALVIRARSPWLDDRRVRALSAAVAASVNDGANAYPLVDDSGHVRAVFRVDDELAEVDEAAALIVIGERESAWRVTVGACSVPGLGGWGYFGVAGLWSRRFPGGTCGTPQLQARAALGVLRLGEVHDYGADGSHAVNWAWTFGHFIGARAGGRHPEAKRRAKDWAEVREMLLVLQRIEIV